MQKPEVTIHGVLVEIFDCGVMLLGESGIGKSESALELITRGHKLVANDAIEIRRVGDQLIGRAPDVSSGCLAVRDLGLIDVREIFGAHSLCDERQIDLCTELLVGPTPDGSGLAPVFRPHNILGKEIEKLKITVSAGRDLPALIEIAVKLFKRRRSGTANAPGLILNGYRAAGRV